MSSRSAHRRAAKAARRKKMLAERRNAALPLVHRIARLADMPLHCCRVHDGLFARGGGVVFLARSAAPDRVVLAGFLVDLYCLGVKQVMLHEGSVAEIDDMIEQMAEMAPFIDADPAYARKLLRDVVAWSRDLGFPPPREYAAAEALFGTVTADDCRQSFCFGDEGRPLYIPGPFDTPTRRRRIIETLERCLGSDGFEVGFSVDDFAADDSDDDLDDEDAPHYDPNEAPDPGEWNELDEDEQHRAIAAYHHRAGIEHEDMRLHAAIHAIVENGCAQGDALPVRRAIARLVSEGLDRHDAVHAIGCVVSEHIFALFNAENPKAIPVDVYRNAVEALTAERWRSGYGEAAPQLG